MALLQPLAAGQLGQDWSWWQESFDTQIQSSVLGQQGIKSAWAISSVSQTSHHFWARWWYCQVSVSPVLLLFKVCGTIYGSYPEGVQAPERVPGFQGSFAACTGKLDQRLWLIGISLQIETLKCKRESATLRAHLHPQRGTRWLDRTLLVQAPSCLQAWISLPSSPWVIYIPY